MKEWKCFFHLSTYHSTKYPYQWTCGRFCDRIKKERRAVKGLIWHGWKCSSLYSHHSSQSTRKICRKGLRKWGGCNVMNAGDLKRQKRMMSHGRDLEGDMMMKGWLNDKKKWYESANMPRMSTKQRQNPACSPRTQPPHASALPSTLHNPTTPHNPSLLLSTSQWLPGKTKVWGKQ